jgi:hypothetical protein
MLSRQVLPYPLLRLLRPLSCIRMRNLEQDQRTSFPEFMYLYDVSQFLTRYAISSDSSYGCDLSHERASSDLGLADLKRQSVERKEEDHAFPRTRDPWLVRDLPIIPFG